MQLELAEYGAAIENDPCRASVAGRNAARFECDLGRGTFSESHFPQGTVLLRAAHLPAEDQGPGPWRHTSVLESAIRG